MNHVNWALIRARMSDARLVPTVLAVCLLSAAGYFSGQKWMRWDTGHEVFLRLAVLVALAVIGWFAAAHLRRVSVVPDSSWWSVGGSLDNPTWADVHRMVMGSPEFDPLLRQSGARPMISGARLLVGYVVLGGVLIEIITLVAAGPILPRLLKDHPATLDLVSSAPNVNWDLNGNLTAFLALIAAAVSIYFTHRQLQAKVRAGSRQAWIDKLRGHIARFIALADEVHEGRTRKGADARTELTSCRLEMELMLNPSEKDHRLLMYLGLRLAFFHDGDQAFNLVHDVRNVKHAIASDPAGYDEAAWQPLLGQIPPTGTDQHLHEYSDLVGYTMRLAHVVLKREWERVKATR